MRARPLLLLTLLAWVAALGWAVSYDAGPIRAPQQPSVGSKPVVAGAARLAKEMEWPPAEPDLATATFASGCFWCTQFDFDHLPGVVSTTTGYIGGRTERPSYYEVASGRTGHVEALQVKYDPAKLSYTKLLDYYWHHVDPLDGNGQFCDRGEEYRPVIFTHSGEQEKQATESRAALEASKRFSRPIAVAIAPAGRFWPAEAVHQKFYKTHQWRYSFYRIGCGRDARLEALWGKESRPAASEPTN